MAADSPMPLLDLVGVSAKSVATVAACASVGAYARRQEVLTKDGEKNLGKFITSVFLPSLILKKLITSTNLAIIISLWPLAFVSLATVTYGLLAGYLGGATLSREMRNLVMVATAFPNSFAVPLTLMLALGPRPELLGAGETAETFDDRVNTLFLMSYSLWVLARWSIGYPLVQGAQTFAACREKVLNPPVLACLLGGSIGAICSLLPSEAKEAVSASPLIQPFQTALEYAGRCAVPCTLMTLGANLDEALERACKPSPVGANLDEPLIEASEKSSIPCWGYLLVLVLRQVVGPLFGAFIAFGFLHPFCGVTSPLVLMVGMLQCAGPPMINLAVMMGMSSGGQKETATILLLTYTCSLFSWTASIAFFLKLLRGL